MKKARAGAGLSYHSLVPLSVTSFRRNVERMGGGLDELLSVELGTEYPEHPLRDDFEAFLKEPHACLAIDPVGKSPQTEVSEFHRSLQIFNPQLAPSFEPIEKLYVQFLPLDADGLFQHLPSSGNDIVKNG